MFSILGKYSAFPYNVRTPILFFAQQAHHFCFFKLSKASILFYATNVTRYFKNNVSLARILKEILKYSVFADVIPA